MAETVFGMKFKDYYKALLQTYADRIKKDKAGELVTDDSKKETIFPTCGKTIYFFVSKLYHYITKIILEGCL